MDACTHTPAAPGGIPGTVAPRCARLARVAAGGRAMTNQANEHPRMGAGLGRLQGKVAVVTGADSGIGRATSRLFAREGGQGRVRRHRGARRTEGRPAHRGRWRRGALPARRRFAEGDVRGDDGDRHRAVRRARRALPQRRHGGAAGRSTRCPTRRGTTW